MAKIESENDFAFSRKIKIKKINNFQHKATRPNFFFGREEVFFLAEGKILTLGFFFAGERK